MRGIGVLRFGRGGMKGEGVCEYLGGENGVSGFADGKVGYRGLEFSLLLVDLLSLLLLGALDCLPSSIFFGDKLNTSPSFLILGCCLGLRAPVKDAMLTSLSQLSISSTFCWGTSVIGITRGTRWLEWHSEPTLDGILMSAGFGGVLGGLEILDSRLGF